jgi:sugar O-acyltransferase (sialic acid O-acetyltransferase NeuD family)
MSEKLVVFGDGDIAEIADFYFRNGSGYEVVAFTVDGDYVKSQSAFGRPLIPFEELERAFPATDYGLFIAVSYGQLNLLRRRKYEEGKARGYRLATYVSRRATVFPGFAPGENCFILEDNTIQPFVRIGNNVTLWSGNHIGHHSIIGDHTFLASHVVVSGGVKIGEQCFIGVNATLRDHINVGDRCVVGAGTLLLADAEPEGVYVARASERSPVPSTRLRKI